MRRALTLIAALIGLMLVAQPEAWAPTVGQPPAPGYPPCTKVGDDGPDVIKGTKRRDVICPDEGNDVVYGRGGNDVIFGGNGVDRLYGGARGGQVPPPRGGGKGVWGEGKNQPHRG